MKSRLFLLIVTSVLFSITVNAADKGLNGGDICENRIRIVRDDIASWIKNGGSSELALPQTISLVQYNTRMLAEIAKAKIICVDSEVKVHGAEKTCENFVAPDGTPKIICNNTRFMATQDSDQYVLVHHEYAGLAGFETNVGESSQYPISNQISGYLESETVKKLAVKTSKYYIVPGSFNFDPSKALSSNQGIPPSCAVHVVHDPNGDQLSLEYVSDSRFRVNCVYQWLIADNNYPNDPNPGMISLSGMGQFILDIGVGPSQDAGLWTDSSDFVWPKIISLQPVSGQNGTYQMINPSRDGDSWITLTAKLSGDRLWIQSVMDQPSWHQHVAQTPGVYAYDPNYQDLPAKYFFVKANVDGAPEGITAQYVATTYANSYVCSLYDKAPYTGCNLVSKASSGNQFEGLFEGR